MSISIINRLKSFGIATKLECLEGCDMGLNQLVEYKRKMMRFLCTSEEIVDLMVIGDKPENFVPEDLCRIP